MAPDFSTPGVYVQEVSIFPPSITSVGTAIPAFIGYTKAANGTVARITSMNDYVAKFGGPKVAWEVTGAAGNITEISGATKYAMYYSVQMYFANGGGPCYVISAGVDTGSPAVSDYTIVWNTGVFQKLMLEDEPTLIVMPDLRLMATSAEAYDVYKAAMEQCKRLQDRFVIVDPYLPSSAGVTALRTDIGTSNLKYAAVYYPDLVLSMPIPFEAVKFTSGSPTPSSLQNDIVSDCIAAPTADWLSVEKNVREAIASKNIVIPPSGAIAGVYASVDRDRGVWKAPANVSLAGVLKPSLTITNDDQADLNLPTNGKAVNAIRTFTGRGTMVWGARTLAGNDNEWRYVSVRRLFIMVEESIRKATEWVVFEPNDANTWLKVKTMIENYLTNLWKDGALAGATPQAAFFVKVGLGQTMTAQDILEGKLIIEIGMAAVRPAEFIILKFSHKLQEA